MTNLNGFLFFWGDLFFNPKDTFLFSSTKNYGREDLLLKFHLSHVEVDGAVFKTRTSLDIRALELFHLAKLSLTNASFPHLSTPSLGNYLSTFCLCEFDCFKYLGAESYSICPLLLLACFTGWQGIFQVLKMLSIPIEWRFAQQRLLTATGNLWVLLTAWNMWAAVLVTWHPCQLVDGQPSLRWVWKGVVRPVVPFPLDSIYGLWV